jgi:hypothetical protein
VSFFFSLSVALTAMAIDWTRTSKSNARESRRAPMMEGKDSLEREVLNREALLWTCPVENGSYPGRTRDDEGSSCSVEAIFHYYESYKAFNVPSCTGQRSQKPTMIVHTVT